MSVMVVWIDPEHARLFFFSEEKMERKIVRPPAFLDSQEDTLEEGEAETRFFEEICSQLLPVGSVLLMGPGEEKDRFRHYLQYRYPLLGKKVVGCETVDLPNDPQIAAIASRYFRSGKAAPGWGG